MPWQTELVEIVRVMADDMDEVKYTDQTLTRVIIVAAFQVLQEVSFTQEFSVDIGTSEIDPDPTESASADDSFSNLICLKAMCILDRGAAGKAAGQAIIAKENSSYFDLRDIALHRIKLLEKGWCKEYSDQKIAYEIGQSSIAGAAVMTPFRVYAGRYVQLVNTDYRS